MVSINEAKQQTHLIYALNHPLAWLKRTKNNKFLRERARANSLHLIEMLLVELF